MVSHETERVIVLTDDGRFVWADVEPVAKRVCAECPKAIEPMPGDGWFHKKDGDSWCPEHIPAWVAAWRAKR